MTAPIQESAFIFLDVDGVLTYPYSLEVIKTKAQNLFVQTHTDYNHLELKIAASYLINEFAVKNLDGLIQKVSEMYRVHIILSSSWRLCGTLDQLKEHVFNRFQFCKYIHSETPFLKGKNRADEINCWLENNRKTLNIKRFVILDDLDLTQHFPKNFVKINPITLLLQHNVEKALKIIMQN